MKPRYLLANAPLSKYTQRMNMACVERALQASGIHIVASYIVAKMTPWVPEMVAPSPVNTGT